MLGVASHFTQRALDRSLVDDAHLIAANMHAAAGRAELGLTEREIRSILFDPVETVLFCVTDAQGRRIAGDARLAGLGLPAQAGPVFFAVDIDGRPLRAVRLDRDGTPPFTVVVAETTVARTALARSLVVYAALPQLLLLLALGLWLRRTVRHELTPLGQIQTALDDRGANDLAPVHVQAGTRDVRRLAAALNSLLGRLDHSLRAQREFAGNVAHELRTPLAGIRALAEYGLSHREPAIWRTQLERIVASQARASRTVDQLLALALALEAQAGLTLVPVALDEQVRQAILRYLPRADAAGVDLGAVGADQTVLARADATLIENLLNNLLDNALRYGADRPEPTVTVAIERRGTDVVLSVQDNGSGMPGEVQQQMLQRGRQGEAGELLGQGAGIGLALVAQYAALMDAGIELGPGPDGVGWVCGIVLRAA